MYGIERATVARISGTGQVFVTLGRLTPAAATPVTVPPALAAAMVVGVDVIVAAIAGSLDELVVLAAL